MVKFALIEGDTALLNMIDYWGAIGFFYNTTLGALLAYLIIGLVILFAVIGFFATIKWLIFGRHKKKKSYGEQWLKTGKI